MRRSLYAIVLSSGMLITGFAAAEVTVTVSKTHLCCVACVKAVDKTLSEVKGVKHEASQEDSTIKIMATDQASAQKAIDALAAAGFHGKLDNKDVKFKAVDAPDGKVKRLEITGVHNCCGACSRSLKEAIKKVAGVQADTVKPKMDTFVVEGEFSAAEVTEALLNAGFHLSVKK